MHRNIARALLILSACSAKAPEAKETHNPPPPPPVQTAQAAPAPRPVANKNLDPREAALSEAIVELVQNQHLLRKKIDDQLSRAAFDMYLERIDPTKMYLLKSDRDGLQKYADKIDDELKAGDLELAHVGAKLMVDRIAKAQGWVAELLAQPFDGKDDGFVELDPKKIEAATTDEELKNRWKRRLELEVMERVSGMEERLADAAKPKKVTIGEKPKKEDAASPIDKIPKTPEERETKARTDLAKSYANRFVRLTHPQPNLASAELLNAVTLSLDPHSDYLPPADKANFDIAMSGTLEGIGAVLREKDEYIEVVEIVPGGASGRQGKLKTGDLILSVQQEGKDPVDTADMHIDDVVKMVRGKKGTTVTLNVRHPDAQSETISIVRDKVSVEETYARGAILNRGKEGPIGYIHLPGFYGGKGGGQRTAAGDVGKLLTEMKNRKAKGVIIDIRSNGGGYLGDAIEMGGELVDKGPMVQVQDSKGRKQVLTDDTPGTNYDGPVIVMVDKFSASASEILAAAMQDYGRAVIVGQGVGTHGKGTVQTVIDLDQATGGNLDLGVVKLTIEQFFRVSGPSTQRDGVTPDIVLPDPNAYIESGEKTMEHAIAASSVQPAPHDQWPATWKIPALSAKSATRVAHSPVFGKISALSNLMVARKSDSRIPIQKAAYDAWRKKTQAESEAVSPKLDTQPGKFTVAIVGEAEGKDDERIAKWKENTSRDPWIDECISIVEDMH